MQECEYCGQYAGIKIAKAVRGSSKKDIVMLIPVSSRPKKPMIAPSRRVVVVESHEVCPVYLPPDPAEDKRRAMVAAKYVRRK